MFPSFPPVNLWIKVMVSAAPAEAAVNKDAARTSDAIIGFTDDLLLLVEFPFERERRRSFASISWQTSDALLSGPPPAHTVDTYYGRNTRGSCLRNVKSFVTNLLKKPHQGARHVGSHGPIGRNNPRHLASASLPVLSSPKPDAIELSGQDAVHRARPTLTFPAAGLQKIIPVSRINGSRRDAATDFLCLLHPFRGYPGRRMVACRSCFLAAAYH
jgi:hypothetical protein